MAINKDVFFKIIDDKIEQTLDSRSTFFPTILVEHFKNLLDYSSQICLDIAGSEYVLQNT